MEDPVRVQPVNIKSRSTKDPMKIQSSSNQDPFEIHETLPVLLSPDTGHARNIVYTLPAIYTLKLPEPPHTGATIKAEHIGDVQGIQRQSIGDVRGTQSGNPVVGNVTNSTWDEFF